jgi:drug/metabolite transporter (DMT)-like permease
MIAVLLAAASALVWGTADYCGGRASRRASAFTVTVISQVVGLPVLVVAVIFLPSHPQPADLAWGAGAGAAGLGGLVLLYRGLASGAMSVVAPITAVTAAVVPMTIGLLTERLPSPVALTGAGCAVVAIALVSLGSTAGRVAPVVIGYALGAGALFGVFFALLAQTSDGSGIWPVIGVRSVSVPLGLLLARQRGAPLWLPGRLLPWGVGAGMGDVAANVLYLVATRVGLLSLVAPIAALYPVSTVLLAMGLDGERLRPIQIAGLGLAVTALVLTAF